MKKNKTRSRFLLSLLLFVLFIAFTAAVKAVDVQAIGPQGSEVGFAGVNGFFFDLLGTSDLWYKITKLLGYLSFVVAGAFALIGLAQLVRRRSIAKVDYRILLLAGFYVLVVAFYALFEKLVVNYRPVILDEAVGLEASYPSSHTMMLICIMATAHKLLPRYCKNGAIVAVGRVVCVLMMVVMPIGRLLSGVHWFTDVLGAVLLSAALVSLYSAAVYVVGRRVRRKKKRARRA